MSKKKQVEKEEKYDILRLDESIKKLINDENKKVEKYKSSLDDIENKLKKTSLYKQKKELEEEKETLLRKIRDIENNNLFAEYVCLSHNIVKDYIELLKKPVKQEFFNKDKKKENNIDVNFQKLQEQFLEVAKRYIPTINIFKQETSKKRSCECGSSDFNINDNTLICNDCGIETIVYNTQTNYKDVDRINLFQKYKYNRRIHFRDIIYQYQGKQNKKFDQNVYDDCEKWFLEHDLLTFGKSFPKDHPDWYKNHSKITKEYIVMALKENKHINNYDDMNYMHNYFTGIPCPNISDIESELMDDFDKFLEVYESFSDLERTNLLNGQYILYRFLKRRKIPADINDFHMVSTRDRLEEYSEIYNRICVLLEWQNE